VKYFLFLLILIFVMSNIYADSIFSNIGFIEFDPGVDNFSTGMGNTGIATTFRRNFSMCNPALNATMYKAGFFTQMSFSNIKYETSDNSFDKTTSNFPTAKVIIPLMKNTVLGFDFLQKYSYGLQTSISDSLQDIGNYSSLTVLEGSINQFGLSITRKISKLDLGFKLGFNYGNKYKGLDIDFEDNDLIDYESDYENIMKGINFTLGFIYPLAKLSLGGFYESTIDLESNNTDKIDFVNNSNLDYVEDSETDFSLPAQIGMGVGYELNNEFYLESNYRQSFWTEATNKLMNERDTKFFSIGLSYIPYKNEIPFSIRIGAYYKELPCKSDNEFVNEKALSLGFDVPLDFEKQGKISLAFSYGNRGNVSKNNMSDNFFSLSLGFQSFDRWLNPQKYSRDKTIPEADETYLEEWE